MGGIRFSVECEKPLTYSPDGNIVGPHSAVEFSRASQPSQSSQFSSAQYEFEFTRNDELTLLDISDDLLVAHPRLNSHEPAHAQLASPASLKTLEPSHAT